VGLRIDKETHKEAYRGQHHHDANYEFPIEPGKHLECCSEHCSSVMADPHPHIRHVQLIHHDGDPIASLHLRLNEVQEPRFLGIDGAGREDVYLPCKDGVLVGAVGLIHKRNLPVVQSSVISTRVVRWMQQRGTLGGKRRR
jgi:hypothetical protein